MFLGTGDCYTKVVRSRNSFAGVCSQPTKTAECGVSGTAALFTLVACLKKVFAFLPNTSPQNCTRTVFLAET